MYYMNTHCFKNKRLLFNFGNRGISLNLLFFFLLGYEGNVTFEVLKGSTFNFGRHHRDPPPEV